MPTHIMLDLETLDTRPGAVVVSIGACVFYPDKNEMGDSFYCKLLIQPQLDSGLTASALTLEWWFKQAEAARKALFVDPIQPYQAFAGFVAWVTRQEPNPAEVRLWGHGSNFDIPILEAAMQPREHGRTSWNVKPTWGYRSARDTRTLFDIVGKKMGDYGTECTVAHDALADALYQAQETMAALREIELIKFLHNPFSATFTINDVLDQQQKAPSISDFNTLAPSGASEWAQTEVIKPPPYEIELGETGKPSPLALKDVHAADCQCLDCGIPF